ncbi:THO complex subunit 7, partial [Bulinus truncatus]
MRMTSSLCLLLIVGQLNFTEVENLVTFTKGSYRLSCTQYVNVNLSDAASCAINCLSSDNCAGLTYNSSNNLCSTCAGNDVTDLLFVADDFMLPRTEWFTNLDAANWKYFQLKSTLKLGSLVKHDCRIRFQFQNTSSGIINKRNMAFASDDDIIRRRLLIDGEGGNDDKRLNNLLKTFIRWSTLKEDDESSQAMYQRMQAMIGQCEYTLEKAMNTFEMNKQELENYEKLSKEIDDKIEEATKRIAEAKQELQLAKCIRKNRQEYDNLAKIIQQQPDRQETTKQLQALDKELANLAKTRQHLEEK